MTPLQAAVYAAAMGNGGILYQPYLINRVENTNGQAILNFEPTVTGELPVSDENLAIIQTAMRMVVNDPRGTAYNRFLNFSIPVYGKTGTAYFEDTPVEPTDEETGQLLVQSLN